MSHDDTTHEPAPREDETADQGGTVSEAGSSSLNAETALGGADSVPDTPDVNDEIEAGADLNVAHERAHEGADEALGE